MKKLWLAVGFVLLTGCSVTIDPGTNAPATDAYEAPVIYEGYYDPTLSEAENVELILNTTGLTGTKRVFKAVENPDKVIVIEAVSPLAEVMVHDIDQAYFESKGYNVDTLFVAGEEGATILTNQRLNTGEFLIVFCQEPDTIPAQYLSWVAEEGTTDYFVVQFNGKGE